MDSRQAPAPRERSSSHIDSWAAPYYCGVAAHAQNIFVVAHAFLFFIGLKKLFYIHFSY
jgi:hypothetical protein